MAGGGRRRPPRRGGEIRVVQYGLGDIGSACARAILETKGLRLAGAVEIDPAKAGRPLGEVLGLRHGARSRAARLRVSASLAGALSRGGADLVVHTTRSGIRTILPQIQEIAAAGLPIVSSTEEMACPGASDPRAAAAIDRLARRRGIAVIAAGVNPGFVMDLLPIVAAATSRNVRSVRVERVLDAGRRRPAFQRKVGVGLTRAEALRRLASGAFGHRGLLESAALIAEGCGLRPDRYRESARPVLARRRMRSAFGTVPPGRVAGLHQVLRGFAGRTEVLRLEVLMALGARDARDAAVIDGDPPVRLRIEGGLHGDRATIGAILNAIPRALAAPPGLHTLLDLPIPRPTARDRRA